MAKFSLLDEEEVSVEVPEGDVLEIIPEDQLDEHAPEESEITDIEEIGEISEGLEAVRDAIAATMAANAMTPEAARLVGVAITLAERNITGRFSSNLETAVAGGGKFGMEGFNDRPSASAYASYAMLSIGSSLKEVWDNIVKFLRKWFNKADLWLNKYVSGAAFAKRKAEGIIKKAEDHKGAFIEEKKVDLGENTAKNLSIDGQFNPARAVESGLSFLKQFKPEEIVKGTEAQYAKFAAIDFEQNNWDIKRLDLITLEDQVKKISAGVELKENSTKYKSTATTKNLLTNNLGGNKMVMLTLSGVETNNIVYFRTASASIKPIEGAGTVKTEQETLDKSGITKLAETVRSAAATIIGMKKDYQSVSAELNKFESKVKTISQKLEKASGKVEDANHAATARLITKSIGGLAGTITAPYSVKRLVQSQTLTSMNAALNYCLKSLDQIKEK